MEVELDQLEAPAGDLDGVARRDVDLHRVAVVEDPERARLVVELHRLEVDADAVLDVDRALPRAARALGELGLERAPGVGAGAAVVAPVRGAAASCAGSILADGFLRGRGAGARRGGACRLGIVCRRRRRALSETLIRSGWPASTATEGRRRACVASRWRSLPIGSCATATPAERRRRARGAIFFTTLLVRMSAACASGASDACANAREPSERGEQRRWPTAAGGARERGKHGSVSGAADVPPPHIDSPRADLNARTQRRRRWAQRMLPGNDQQETRHARKASRRGRPCPARPARRPRQDRLPGRRPAGRHGRDRGHAAWPSPTTRRSPRNTPPMAWACRRRCTGPACRPQATSLVVIVEDADAPTPQPLVHAIVVDLPAGDGALAEGALPSPDHEGDGLLSAATRTCRRLAAARSAARARRASLRLPAVRARGGVARSTGRPAARRCSRRSAPAAWPAAA